MKNNLENFELTQTMCQNCDHVEQIQKLLNEANEFGYNKVGWQKRATVIDYIFHIAADCSRTKNNKRFMEMAKTKLVEWFKYNEIFENLEIDLCQEHYQTLFKTHLPNCNHKYTRSGLCY